MPNQPSLSGRVGHCTIREATEMGGYLVDCDCGRKRVRKTVKQVQRSRQKSTMMTCDRYCPLTRKTSKGVEPGARRVE